MAEGLQYKENIEIISGGYPGENPYSDGAIQTWTDTSGSSGSNTVTYYYRDSRTMDNNNCSLVAVQITDSWSATVDANNVYHITVNTVINSITRTRVGNPGALRATISIKRTSSGAILWSSGSCVDATITTTYGTNINLGSYTFDLQPGQANQDVSTVYYRSNICGHDFDQPGSIYVDEYAMGVSFRNILPPDYRPGKIMNNGNTWQSHNRTGGADNIWNGSSWKTMRTDNGPTGQDNPPYMRHQSDWRNQRKIGANS